MSNIIPFSYNSKQVRTIIKDGEPWFVAKDICDILEISNSRDAISRLDDDEKNTVAITDGNRGNPNMTIISESGVYALIFTSRKPESENFKRWIRKEVIPSIRKTGGYIANDELFIETYLPFADETTKSLFKATLQTVRNQNELILKQQKEIQHKEDVIIGLVDNIELAEKRQILNQVVRYKNANFRERWAELYRQFEMKYHIDLGKRLANYNKENKPKLRNKIDYIDKVMHKIPELYEIACKLYEGDIKDITEKLYKIA